MLLSNVSLRGDVTRLQTAAAGYPACCRLLLASDWSLALTGASHWLGVAGYYAAAVSPGTAADSAAAFDLHWENQSGFKDRQETGNTFLLATARHQHTTQLKVLNLM